MRQIFARLPPDRHLPNATCKYLDSRSPGDFFFWRGRSRCLEVEKKRIHEKIHRNWYAMQSLQSKLSRTLHDKFSPSGAGESAYATTTTRASHHRSQAESVVRHSPPVATPVDRGVKPGPAGTPEIQCSDVLSLSIGTLPINTERHYQLYQEITL